MRRHAAWNGNHNVVFTSHAPGGCVATVIAVCGFDLQWLYVMIMHEGKKLLGWVPNNPNVKRAVE